MMYNSFNEVKKMENGVLLQGFHWYIKPEEKLWKQLQEKVKSYKEMGFSAIWLPPAYKLAPISTLSSSTTFPI